MRKVTFLVILLILAILVSACNKETPTATSEPTAETATEPTATPEPTALPDPTNTPEPAEPTPTTAPQQPAEGASEALNVTWQWTELHDADGQTTIADPENYTLTFQADGTFQVKADCNSGSGTYTLDGNKLTFGPMAMTAAECGPESLFDLFTKTLGSVDTVAVESGKLVMNLTEGAGKMVFEQEPASTETETQAPPDTGQAAALPSGELTKQVVGAIWQWAELTTTDPAGQQVVPDPENYVLVFQADGTVSVKADCNQGSGTYALEGNKLTFGPIAITQAYCGDDSLDGLFLQSLEAVEIAALENGRLVLTPANGSPRMVFNHCGWAKLGPRQPDLRRWIVGAIWQWAELTTTDPASQQVVPDPENYTLVFQADGTVNVKADCNQGSGTYTLEGNKISFGPIALTRAYCGDDSLDGLYVESLAEVEIVAMENGRLVLAAADGTLRMVFNHCGWAKWGPQDPTPTPAPGSTPALPIVGTIWQWTEHYVGSSQQVVPDPENYTLVFQADGTVSVKADCNQGSGTYTLDGSNLSFGPLAITQAYCGDDSLDGLYLQSLAAVGTAAIENGRLILTSAEGRIKMVFNPCGTAKLGQPSCDLDPRFVGIIWQWTEFHEPDGQTVVPDPQNYVLVFRADGTFTIQADCNQGSGTYTLDGTDIDLDVTQLTQAECGEGSLDELYLLGLDSASTVAVENGRLVLIMPDGVGKMVFNYCGWSKEPANPLLGVLWMWERFVDQSGENDIEIGDPSLYTLQLLPKGVFRIRVDCNTGGGTYYLSSSQLTLTLGAITRAECGPNSLHDQYLAMLGDVVTYVLDGDKLVLNLKADAGNMIFGQGNGTAAGAASGTTAQEPAPAPVTGMDASSVTLDTQGLPVSWQASVVPAMPYDNSQPPGPMGLPEHIQINFGVTSPADKQPGDPVMYIVPVQAYRDLWEAQGDPGVSVLVETQQKMLQDRPTPFPPAGIPVLPFEELGGTNDLAVQGVYLDSPTMSGMRFVGRFSQGPNTVTNEGLRYIYQGYAGDANEYLVAFFYPVSTTALPNSAGEVPSSETDRLNADPGAYMQERAETLNGLADTDWEPNLSVLDAVVASLQF